MHHKYQLLKSNWGIVIFLEIDEILNPSTNETDVRITDNIFLRVTDTYKLNKETITYWMGAGIKALAGKINNKISNQTVCYDIRKIDLNYADFQEEGLYCAIQEWISKYYDIALTPVDIKYDHETNKYIFNI